jgi:hypothetical protein
LAINPSLAMRILRFKVSEVKGFFRWFLVIFFLLGLSELYAQSQYGNEWIRFNQQYVKVPVAKDGVYRVNLADLEAAGLPLNDLNRIQLFHRGSQVARRIVPGQYIEFYGRKNDGISDAPLYKPSTQSNTHYNLFSDTTAYFFTANTQGQLGISMDSYTEINDSGIPTEVFHSAEKLLLLTSQYSSGVWYNGYAQTTEFDAGEGWVGAWINKDQFIDYTISGLNFPATSSGVPQLEVQVVGQAGNTFLTHRVEISVGPTTPSRIVATQDFATNTVATVTATLNWTDISAGGNLVVRIKALGVGGGGDRISGAYIKVTFPQSFNLSGATESVLTLRENPSNKSYIQLQNAPVGARLFDITDERNPIIIGTTTTSTVNAVINNTSVSRKVVVTNVFITPVIKRVTFRELLPDPAKNRYVIVSHKLLMKPAGEYANPVKSFAGYRASAVGGSYDTLVLEMTQLYNQFNYGEISPLAIRRLMKYLVDKDNPKYLFLIGKGLDVYYNYHRNPSSFTTFQDLVPVAGLPPSDMAFTAGLAGNGYEPAVPTGRITASTPSQVTSYLNKVKEIESLPFDALWRKEVLHLSGGLYQGEPELFKAYVDQFGEVAKSNFLGGKVSSIAKESTEQEFIIISDKINAGVGLVTLFGHSDPNGGDFNVGLVSTPQLGYNNPGKYPMFLVNGCNAGEFFSATTTRYGEDWTLAPNKGAVGFIAHSSFGFASLLRFYSNTFYAVGFGDNTFINKGIGDVQKEVAKRVTDVTNAPLYVTQAQQMVLLGDPALKLFGAGKPDYDISETDLDVESFTQEPVTALSDSFALKIIVRNFGIAPTEMIRVSVKQIFEDETFVEYDSLFPSVLYQDTLTFKILKNDKGFGQNKFVVSIDALNEVDELNEDNNIAELQYLIPLNSSKNLFPNNFSIVNETTVTLTVQSSDVFGQARDFIIEVDTIPTFDSQFKKQFTVNGKIASVQVDLVTDVDTLAYYWQSKFSVSQPGESEAWATSSFTYIANGPEGWAQVHFPQLMSGNGDNILLDASSRKIEFDKTITDISVLTFGSLHPLQTEVSIKLNGTEYHPRTTQDFTCRNNTINLMAFDKTTTVPYIGYVVTYPNGNVCGRRPEVIASYTAAEVESGLTAYLANIQPGDSVILFTIGDPGISNWSATTRSKAAELGISSSQLDAITAGEPVVIFAKKNAAPGSAQFYRTSLNPANEQVLQVDRTITGRSTSGILSSTVVGPAVVWQSFYAKTEISELPQTDELSFDIIGIMLTGEEAVLRSNITNSVEDLSDIDALEYPYLRIKYHVKDEINLTPPQLKKWVVAYTPAPEGVIVYNGTFEQQVLSEGEVWTGNFSFQNISEKQFIGPLTVQYTVNNTTQRKTFIDEQEIAAPLPGQKTDFNVAVNTVEKVGLNNVKIFVNPRIVPELYFDNNTAELKSILKVERDEISPVLDVTIDGRYVKNGDYVAANPVIRFQLWDENKLILKTDTLGIRIFLNNTQLFFERNQIAWTSATATLPFTAQFIPSNLGAGDYVLQIEASDARGNDVSYEVMFVVAEDNTIKISKAYPNPSTTYFFFDVMVTGEPQPDVAYLQIINLTGSIVGEFRITEFYTGTNKLVWNSTDTHGNQLPNGLYVYRVMVNRGGKQLKSASGKILLNR